MVAQSVRQMVASCAVVPAVMVCEREQNSAQFLALPCPWPVTKVRSAYDDVPLGSVSVAGGNDGDGPGRIAVHG